MLFIDYLAITAVMSFFLTGTFLAMYIANRSYLPNSSSYAHLNDEVYCDVCGTHYTTEDPCPYH